MSNFLRRPTTADIKHLAKQVYCRWQCVRKSHQEAVYQKHNSYQGVRSHLHPAAACFMLVFLHRLSLNSEDEGGLFLRNIGSFSMDYMDFYFRRKELVLEECSA
jgi:hypothetical protein